MQQVSGECIDKASCPECGSSDGVQIFQKPDGRKDAYCFACETRYNKVDGLTVIKEIYINNKPTTPRISMEDVSKLSSSAIEDRGIREEIVEAFSVKLGFSSTTANQVDHHFYPNYTLEGQLQGYDHRTVEGKVFSRVGETKNSMMFGQNFCRSSKKLFITEGHCDAMALYQVLLDHMAPSIKAKGYLPNVVSITNGITGAMKQLEANAQFISRFKEVILVFDTDTPGKAGAEKVAKSLDARVLIADFPLKDANDMLLADRGKELQEACLYNAQPYEPDGIINGSDAWDRYKEKKDMKCYPYPEQFEELNRKTYGWRLGTVVTVTSGSGMGKTQFLRELKYDILKNTDFKIADIALEEDIGDTVEGLMALELNKRIHLPDVKISEEEEAKAFKELFGEGRVELYDHFGGMSDSSLFSRMRYFGTYLKCQVMVLDHLSIVISETADEGDERRRIDAVMTKLTVMAKALNIVIFLVVHLRKAGQGKSFEEGYVPTSDDLRGSAAIKQLSADVIALSRNQQEPDEVKRNTSGLHVLKCRFSGDTGQAGYSFFDPLTGRMVKGVDPTVEVLDEESEF